MTEVAFTRILSGSTDGRGIAVAATSTPGTLLHTAIVGVDHLDCVTLYATNTDTVNRTLTVEFGGVTDPDDQIKTTIAPSIGLVLIVPGFLLRNGLVVRAFADSGSKIVVFGSYSRIPVNPNLAKTS